MVSKILLVDDEVEFAKTLAMRLEIRGFETATAASGDDALETLDHETFDVIVLDLVMPGLSGLETLCEIKRRTPLTEVIILTGKGTEDAAIEGMQCGAFDFLTKPPDISALAKKINDAHARKTDHLARIQKASESGRMPTVAATPVKPVQAVRPDTDKPAHHGRLLVLGQQSDFSQQLIDYALDMAKRLSYEILAVNAAGFPHESFRSFPSAREKVCQNFRIISKENVIAFQKAAEELCLHFSHIVMCSDPDEAIREIREEVGHVDFVVSEPADELIDSASGLNIIVYAPA